MGAEALQDARPVLGTLLLCGSALGDLGGVQAAGILRGDTAIRAPVQNGIQKAYIS